MRRFTSLISKLLVPAVMFAALACAEQRVASAESANRWEGLREGLRDRFGGWLGLAETPDEALARRGGSRILLRADTDDFRTAVLNDLRNDVRRLLREARIGYSGLFVRDGSVEVRVRDLADLPHALSALAATAGPQPSGAAVDVRDMGEGLIQLAPT